MKQVAIAMGLALALPNLTFVAAAQAQAIMARLVTVEGVAEREVVPDQALVTVNLESKAREVADAKAQNDAKLKKLYEIAGEMQIPQTKLKTGYSSLQPSYRYHENQQVFEGYVASASIIFTVDDPAKVAALLDKLVKTGAENIGNVEYRVANEQRVRDEVMLAAVDHARGQAEKLAAQLGEALGRVMAVSQGNAASQQPIPFVQPMLMKEVSSDRVAPPMGLQKIEAHVTVSFALGE